MQHGIREFRPRQPLDRQLSSDTLNRILREMESLRITRVVNGTFKKLPGGTEIVVAPQSGGTSPPATVLPWDLLARPDPESTSEPPPYLVTVQPGMLSGFLAVNWDDEFTLSGTGLYYAKAVVSTDGSAITQVTIEIDTTPPEEQQPELWAVPGTVEYLFGLFVEGEVFRTIGPSHITISPKVWITTEKTALPAPGELPYDYYYVLG